MKRYIIISCILFTFLLLTSCERHIEVPSASTPTSEKLLIYPDYTDIVIPENIAPLNFMVRNSGDEFVVAMEGAKGSKLVAGGTKNGKIEIDSLEWRQLLQTSRNAKIKVTVYARRDAGWVAFKSYSLRVAEPIDAYLSYRLIEPGYELYRQLGLYQRNLTTFDVQTIYENNRTYHTGENHCINCHNYQNYDASTMLFHVRGNMGGTLFARDGKIEKMNMKCDSVLSNAVYPSWNPKHPWLVFSSNKTGQTFHLLNHEKVEVIDSASDLIYYNTETKQISNVLKTPTDLENFPCWTPTGDRVFYCVAHMPSFSQIPDSLHTREVVLNYTQVKYNLMSIPFDEKTQTFGEPRLEVDCEAMGKSVSVPRVSPDGRYVLFTLGDYGQFHIWHKSSDLYVKDLQTGKVYPMKASNSGDVDSFHSWSSNNRWFVFSSRRDDGSFTRPYIAYFDRNGQSHKAFILPQKDPEHNLLLFKSYNVPELTRNAVPYQFKEFRDAIYQQKGTPVTYREIRNISVGNE